MIEFLKEEQVAFEKGMPLNMGQLLSVPFIAVGIFLVWFSTKTHPGSLRGQFL
jgi:prolipoprotein diacylglyceryltransferase